MGEGVVSPTGRDRDRDAAGRPRQSRPRDALGRPLPYGSPGVESVMFPWSRITFLEIMVDEEERGKVIDFFRLD